MATHYTIMTSCLYITIAIGAAYEAAADQLVASARRRGWTGEFVVIRENADNPRPDNLSQTVFAKLMKTGFGAFIPPAWAGPVILLDADMLATGTLPPYQPREVAASDIRRASCRPRFLDSCFVVFASAEIARRFSKRWCDIWKTHYRRTDVPAFNQAADEFHVESLYLSPDRQRPVPGLRHLLLGTLPRTTP